MVFLAACDSEIIGNIFLQSGVRYVVCVQKEGCILDDVAVYFTFTFYKYLFDGIQICKAF